MEWDEPLRRAIDQAGGPQKVADGLGIRTVSLYAWTKTPHHRVQQLVRLPGVTVTPTELRPDLYPPQPQETT